MLTCAIYFRNIVNQNFSNYTPTVYEQYKQNDKIESVKI